MATMIKDFIDEFARYKDVGEKALAQTPDAAINTLFSREGNTASTIVRHLGGNLSSRFTDFLTTDGEKPWRDRDAELRNKDCSRQEIHQAWKEGWSVLEKALASLTDADMGKEVYIRGEMHTVHQALVRSIAHTSYHVGQLVVIGRLSCEGPWNTITVPHGKYIPPKS